MENIYNIYIGKNVMNNKNELIKTLKLNDVSELKKHSYSSYIHYDVDKEESESKRIKIVECNYIDSFFYNLNESFFKLCLSENIDVQNIINNIENDTVILKFLNELSNENSNINEIKSLTINNDIKLKLSELTDIYKNEFNQKKINNCLNNNDYKLLDNIKMLLNNIYNINGNKINKKNKIKL